MEKEEIKKMILAKKKWEKRECGWLNVLELNGRQIFKYYQDPLERHWSVSKVINFNTEPEAVAFCESELEKYVEGLLA